MNLEKLRRILSDNGCQKVYVKSLAKNDDSKHQPYLGGNAVFNLFPTADIVAISPGDWKRERFIATINLAWIGEEGELFPAPNAKFILYPKYPEVRLSGFAKGCQNAPSELMNTPVAGRLLFLSVSAQNQILSFVTAPDSSLAHELARVETTDEGVFKTFTVSGQNTRVTLLSELARIHRLGWIPGKQLKSDGRVLPCNAFNCGGNTLEAELGVAQNGYAEPDFMGWEVKQYGVDTFNRLGSSVITLMTPNPTGGLYKSEGLPYFIKTYGYPDKLGRPNRINIGGIHRVGVQTQLTQLTMTLIGFDVSSGKIKSAAGCIALIDAQGNEAATWSFASMLTHWNRKHNQACFVPSLSDITPDARQYQYGGEVMLGIETDYEFFLQQMAAGNIYYDPAIKMVSNPSVPVEFKARSQFRMKSAYLSSLYRKSEIVDVTAY